MREPDPETNGQPADPERRQVTDEILALKAKIDADLRKLDEHRDQRVMDERLAQIAKVEAELRRYEAWCRDRGLSYAPHRRPADGAAAKDA